MEKRYIEPFYLIKSNYKQKGALKQLGCKWDSTRKAWVTTSAHVASMVRYNLGSLVTVINLNDPNEPPRQANAGDPKQTHPIRKIVDNILTAERAIG